MASAFPTLEDLQWAIEGANVGTWTWDVASDRVQWSDTLARMFDRQPGLHPRTRAEYEAAVHPDDRAAVGEVISTALTRGDAGYKIIHRVVRSSGELRWANVIARIQRDPDGSPVRVGGVVIDITERQEAVEAMRQREEELHLVTALSSDYVYAADVGDNASLIPTIVSGSFERTTGHTPELVAERGGWVEVIHPDDRGNVGELMAALAAGRPFVNEYRITRPDGEVRWLRDRCRPVLRDGTLVRLVGGVQDITEHKALEQQLAHAQRMEALARMASSVAHDFNNILLVISASLDLMRGTVESNPNAAALGKDIRNACDRAAELTHSLLAFSRKSVVAPQVVNPSDLLRMTRPILERAVGEAVRLDLDVDDACGTVLVDPGQLQMALLNLVLNARAAMPDGGRVRMRLRRGGSADVPLAALEAGTFVVIEVADDGHGIAPDVLPHIFEPFFTTRPLNEGTGLGLATCHGIVTQARGTIRVQSEAGRGATFSIFLPESNQRVVEAPVGLEHGTIGGTERVLLVEDDPIVRRLTVRILKAHGYHVHEAANLREARTIVPSSYDLLLSDVRLPDGNGVALAAELRLARHDLPVLLVSGFVDDDARDQMAEGRYPLLHKPYSADVLVRRVRDALDGATNES